MTRVISYTRFSSKRQAKGVSYARQIEAARKWCAANGYVLDENDQYEDLGVSGFSGKNASQGALSVLLKKLLLGEIERGTILIVEALDRLTRRSLSEAITLLTNLSQNGLRIVTLADNQTYDTSKMNDLGGFLMSVVTLYRGHQESAYKSARVRDAFQRARKEGSQKVFGSAPGWLSREDKSLPWVIDEEKAAVVRRVFELSAAGFGSKLIAKKANDEGWIVPTRLAKQEDGWHAQMAGALLRNRAVVGEHQHRIRTYEAQEKHWQGNPIGDVIADYYPRIISDELWNLARSSISARAVAKRRDTQYYNVFSGVMYCGHCGAPIQRKSEKSGHSKGQLQCSYKLAGKTDCKTMAVNRADPSILQSIYEYSIQTLGTDEARKAEAEIAALETEIKDKQKECERIAEALLRSDGAVEAFVKMSMKVNSELKALQRKLVGLRNSQEKINVGTVFDEAFVTDAMNYMYVPNDEYAKEKRAELHLKVTRLVDTIWLFAYDLAYIKYKNGLTHAVALPHKQLPSRANPKAKNHRPPKEKPEQLKVAWQAAVKNTLVLPEPIRSHAFTVKERPVLPPWDDEYYDTNVESNNSYA